MTAGYTVRVMCVCGGGVVRRLGFAFAMVAFPMAYVSRLTSNENAMLCSRREIKPKEVLFPAGKAVLEWALQLWGACKNTISH